MINLNENELAKIFTDQNSAGRGFAPDCADCDDTAAIAAQLGELVFEGFEFAVYSDGEYASLVSDCDGAWAVSLDMEVLR